MAEQLKYVSPEYQERLDNLAATLMTAHRLSTIALEDTVEFPAIQDPLQDTLFDLPVLTD